MKKMFFSLLALVLTAALLASCAGAKAAKSLDLDRARADIEALGIYPSLMEPDDTLMKDIYGIDPALVVKRAAGVPLINVHAAMYWLVLAKDAADAETLRGQFDVYFEDYQKMWDSYLPAQADLVKNRLETSYDTDEGVWLLYVISEDNEAVRAAVEGALVK